MQRIETSINVFKPKSISITVSPTEDVLSIRFKCDDLNNGTDHDLTISCFIHTNRKADRKLPLFTVQDVSEEFELVPIADLTESIRKALTTKSHREWGKKYAK